MLCGLVGEVGIEDVFDALKLEGLAVEPNETFENLEGTPFVKGESPLIPEFSEFGNKLFELLLEAGL